jgi:murein DD-endopeptidase MepM/ murein hydrolase activator NlpD
MRFAIVLLSCTLTSVLPHLVTPIAGLTPQELHDTFNESRGGHLHEAIDIMQPRGTPVHAVIAGTIRKLFLSKAGGNTIYQFDNDSRYAYYYAHLDRYSESLKEGMHVDAGAVIGYVGSTGDASPDAPHLHFTVFELGPAKEWWKGKAVNPYAALLAAVKRSQWL